MKTHLTKIEVFDTKFFPHGVAFDFAPITLFGGSLDASYLHEAIRSVWAGFMYTQSHNFKKLVAHNNNDVFSFEYIDDKSDITKVFCNGQEVKVLEDERLPILNTQDQVDYDESYDFGFNRKDTKVHWIPLMSQKHEKHPKFQWEFINKKIAQASMEDIQLIIEANSDITYNAVRILIKEGDIDPKDVLVHYFALDKRLGENGYYGDTIIFDRNGTPNIFPEGFLDTYSEQMLRLV